MLSLDCALAVGPVRASGSARSATGAVMANTLAVVFLVCVIVLSSNCVAVLGRAMTPPGRCPARMPGRVGRLPGAVVMRNPAPGPGRLEEGF
ncbi:hypothetical protein GCM10022284_46520 [Streptomyces hundungensis]